MTPLLFIKILKKYMGFIILFTLIFTISITGISFFIKPTYSSEAKILILDKQETFNIFKGLSETLIFNLLNTKNSNVYDLISILQSKTLAKRVIKKLNLENNKDLESSLPFNKLNEVQKLKNFQKRIKIIPPSSKDNTITLIAYFSSPTVAFNVVNEYLTELDKYLKELNTSTLNKNREFISTQVIKTKQRLFSLENELCNFQKKYNTIALTEEIKSNIQQLSKIESEVILSRIGIKELEEKIKNINKNFILAPSSTNLLSELEINKAALKKRELELDKVKFRYNNLLKSLPVKAVHLARLEREIKLQSELYLLLSQEFEKIKIEENKELEIFRILDKPMLNDAPVKPNRLIILFVSLFFGVIFAIFISFLDNYIKENKYIK